MDQKQEIVGLELAAPAALQVTLETIGNPDFGQNPNQPMYGVHNNVADATSLAMASTLCRRFITDHGVGGGNWAGGQVTDQSGNLVATVSYNGRVWRNE